MAGIKDFVNRFTRRATWFVFSRFQESYRRNVPYELVWRKSAEDSADFIAANLHDAVLYQHRVDFWQYILGCLPAHGEICEIGVFQGASVNLIADNLAQRGDARLVNGFDAFEGLEEDWSGEGLPAGFFNQGGKLPEVRGNVRLHKGWVQDTLGPFLAERSNPALALVHIDTDTYTPAHHILSIIKPLLDNGTIIVFDELIGYPNWRNHEYKALVEVLDPADYAYIAFTSRQAAIRIVRKPDCRQADVIG